MAQQVLCLPRCSLNRFYVDVWQHPRSVGLVSPEAQVQQWQTQPGEPSIWWTLEQKFSNKPFSSKRRNSCRNQQFQDPLAEPPLVSGSFTSYTEETKYDRNGQLIQNSAFETVHGPLVEIEQNRPSVHIEQNVAAIGLTSMTGMQDHVNDSTLWGLPKRCIKLSNIQWERKWYGTCSYYYTRKFDFEIKVDTWDKIINDEGTKCFVGQWLPDEDNPRRLNWTPDDVNFDRTDPRWYMRMIDVAGNPITGPLNGMVTRRLDRCDWSDSQLTDRVL